MQDVKPGNLLIDKTLHMRIADLETCRKWSQGDFFTHNRGTYGFMVRHAAYTVHELQLAVMLLCMRLLFMHADQNTYNKACALSFVALRQDTLLSSHGKLNKLSVKKPHYSGLERSHAICACPIHDCLLNASVKRLGVSIRYIS